MKKHAPLMTEADAITQALWAFVPEKDGNAVFRERSFTFFSAMMYPLLHVYTKKGMRLSVTTVYDYTAFDQVMLLAGLAKKKMVCGTKIPNDLRLPLQSYLRALPDFNEKKKQQSPETLRQHEFSQVYIRRIMNSLAPLARAGIVRG